ncbi:hypothetical protein [uncultured Roseovarius sp.]|uniref:hypothetical protein n=1 Tax=uncultured Roseovarius sp. TaxID=293344 RepID=UPI002597B93D|nr:hypothetical protein [uncultured Roseovarius sp.]
MKVSLVILSSDTDVLDFFNARQGSVVAKELRKSGRQFNVLCLSHELSPEEITNRLVLAHERSDCVGIVVEDKLRDSVPKEKGAIFTKEFNATAAKPSLQNYFGHQLARWLKNLLRLSEIFRDGKQKKCLMLPLENFQAPEIDRLKQIIRSENDESQFFEKLEGTLKNIRNRSVPKKKKSGQRHFLKDDKEHYYELAKERHGQAETATPPHFPLCALSAASRFGISLNREEHYNVSIEDGNISGEFAACHGTPIRIGPCTHINMFPNGHIR